MSNGLYSDIFIQAELDYRRDRAVAATHPKGRPMAGRHHLPWRRAAAASRTASPRRAGEVD